MSDPRFDLKRLWDSHRSALATTNSPAVASVLKQFGASVTIESHVAADTSSRDKPNNNNENAPLFHVHNRSCPRR